MGKEGDGEGRREMMLKKVRSWDPPKARVAGGRMEHRILVVARMEPIGPQVRMRPLRIVLGCIG